MDSSNLLKEFSDNEYSELSINYEKSQFSIIDESSLQDELNFENDKENSNIGCSVERKYSSRASVLKSLDPYDSSDFKNKLESSKMEDNLAFEFKVIHERNADKSIDLLDFDVSIVEDERTPTKKSCPDNFQCDFPLDLDNSLVLKSPSNISQLLNETIDEHDDVATDNLIGLSPIKVVVDKETFNKLRKYHNEAKQTWLEKETNYQNVIERLKEEHDNKINELLKENEENIQKIISGHKKAFNAKQNEFDENLSKINLNHEHSLRSKELESEKTKKELAAIQTEMLERESVCLMYITTCDQIYDTSTELMAKNASDKATYEQDVQAIEAWMANNANKSERFQEKITVLQKNANDLKSEVVKYKTLVDELNGQLERSNMMVDETEEKRTVEMRDLKILYEKNMRRLEVKIKQLGIVEGNLKLELELRVKENKELMELVDNYVDRN